MSTPEQTQQVPGYATPPQATLAPLPGKGLGIAGFVLAFMGPVAIVGLVLSIIAVVKGRAAKRTNGLAIAGIIMSILVLIGTALFAVGIIALLQTCQDLGPGVHLVGGVTYTCS